MQKDLELRRGCRVSVTMQGLLTKESGLGRKENEAREDGPQRTHKNERKRKQKS